MVDLTTQEKRIADRLEELIAEGHEVATLERPYENSTQASIRGEHRRPLLRWLATVQNLLQRVFGPDSAYFREYQKLAADRYISQAEEVYAIVGLAEGALEDLRRGFLVNQELLIAGEVFDSLLDQASHLCARGYKDPAAVLTRVVLEDGLRRISRQEDLDHTLSAGNLNENLREAGRYSKPQWRQIQTWLDIGNAAAHGEFDEYDHELVGKLINDLEVFLARELS